MKFLAPLERLVFIAKLNRWLKTLSAVLPSESASKIEGLSTSKVRVSAGKQEMWRRPPRGRVLVVAPHPDDEAIGCGGAIALHRRQKDSVTVIWLYDLTPVRRAEAERAARTLKFEGYFGRQYLKKLLPEADILYLPGLAENNLDHLRAHDLVVPLLRNTGYEIRVLLYEVWGPLLPNRLLTIDPVIGVKEKAIQVYRSQLKERDYVAAAISLNRYRGTSLAAGKFAEAFLELAPDEYLKMIKILR